MKPSDNLKEHIVLCLAVFCELSATIAIFLAIFIEPRGEIHSSILTYYGMAASFTGILLGVEYKYSQKQSEMEQQMKQFESKISNMINNADQPSAHPTD